MEIEVLWVVHLGEKVTLEVLVYCRSIISDRGLRATKNGGKLRV